MFGASALYRRFTWSQPTRLWLRRLDHAGIFGLIAATYTPFGLLVLHGAWQKTVLAVAWSGAALAILTKLTGGVCYTLGALVHARRKPDLLPRVFGYHELCHALVVAAVALQYTAVALVVPG
jgi:hemolysin III